MILGYALTTFPKSLIWTKKQQKQILHRIVSSRRTLHIEEALGVTTSTDKMEVEVFPHVAKSSVGVLTDNSTVWTKGQLPAPSTNSK